MQALPLYILVIFRVLVQRHIETFYRYQETAL